MYSKAHPSISAEENGESYPDATRYRFVIAGLIMFLCFTLGLGYLPIGPIAPLVIANYEINNVSAGLLTSIIFLVHIPLSIPAGLLVGRIGLKKLIALGALAGCAPLLSFLATDSFLFLLATRAILSLGMMIVIPATGPLFMQWFRPKELPLANGALLLTVSMGITISQFVVVPLSNAFRWEVVLSGFGGLSLLGAVAWIFFGKASRVPTRKEGSSLVKRLREVLASRNTLLIAAADAGPVGLLTVSVGWLPMLYHKTHGFSLTETGILMGILSLVGSISLVLASLLTATTHKRRPFLIIPGTVIGFAGFAAILLGDSVALYIAIAVLGFTNWFYLPALLTIPMELYPNDPSRVSLILAALMTGAGIAGFVAAPMVGAIADLTGSLIPGIAIFAALSWSLGFAGLFLPETGSASTHSQSP